MKKLNNKTSISLALFFLFLINIIQTFGKEAVEGDLYPIEVEESQIREESLKKLLCQDKTRIWNNCFSDDSFSERKNIFEKQEEPLGE